MRTYCCWFLPQAAFCTSLFVRRFIPCFSASTRTCTCSRPNNLPQQQSVTTTTTTTRLMMMTIMIDPAAVKQQHQQQMDLLLLDVPSATDKIRSEAAKALVNVCLKDQALPEALDDDDDDDESDDNHDVLLLLLGRQATKAAMQLRDIAAAPDAVGGGSNTNQANKLQVRQQIQSMSTELLRQSHLALCLIMAALCFIDDTTPSLNERSRTTATRTTTNIGRTVASAVASILEEANTKNGCHPREEGLLEKSELVLALVHRANALLVSRGYDEINHRHTPAIMISVDLHIVTQLAKALGVDSCPNLAAETAVADVIRRVLQIDFSSSNNQGNDDDDDNDDISAYSVSIMDNNLDKVQVAAALALAAQLAPWKALRPTDIVDVAVRYELWHAAERICMSTSPVRKNSDDSADVAVQATQTLIDAALEAKTYRRADNYATEFYDNGGPARFLEARYLHACDTIAKVIRRRALPVIEKQVERVDKSVEQVKNDTRQNSVDASLDDKCTTSVETASNDIRTFALRQLEESGDIDNAHRLANIWNMDHIYDENALQAALAARREKYLQWADVFPDTSIPDLLSSSEVLINAFSNICTKQSVYGFDVEWGDDHGAALLQVATSKRVILIDIPALSKTIQGADALKSTVGDLFANKNATVVGFGCRQDLARLRATPCASESHWLSDTVAIIDLQAMISKMDPSTTCQGLGLSRCCERFLGKPLDKSEQCSLWTRRPLAEQQRVYAALDAYACAAIFAALSSPNQSSNLIKEQVK